jgi:hypothetical protein
LTIEYEGREAVGRLEWDPPPSLTAVEKVLRAHLGNPSLPSDTSTSARQVELEQ